MSIAEVKQSVKSNVMELGRQVVDNTSESIKAADRKKQILDMEREIRLDRIGAELKHRKEVHQMKKTVLNETRESKNNN